MKFSFLLLVLLGTSNALACSVHVDENYIKNQLMAHGVSYFDLSLTSVTGLSVTNFQKVFSDSSGGGSCPSYLNVAGDISLQHSPTPMQHCTYAVRVAVRSYIGDDIPMGPMEEVSFTTPTAACSTSISRLRIPRKFPIRLRRPVVINRFNY